MRGLHLGCEPHRCEHRHGESLGHLARKRSRRWHEVYGLVSGRLGRAGRYEGMS